ncbi:thiamine diphosphokinase [Candidatus Uabimicrobium amorphum]|uniref:Thiamine diphosphokinase n=1 Tax=Uabimicrobium amorphum TaxID=2596890 RepID=A0A5S9F2L3_UABAM|nr:thiamine diphosphokinase [Candidatus Uabimicrobium amorphum]BBM83797.1 thiamine pyrophosphokinase [Candidatus Uabimicrobium amorphum]
MKRAAVMSGGTTPEEDPFYKNVFDDYQFRVAVDMGMNVFHRLGLQPDILVGDLDSICPSIDISQIDVHKFPQDKDKTDTELAIDLCMAKGFSHIDILGGIGNRLDHTLANAYLLVYGNRPDNQIRLRNAHNTIYLLTGEKSVCFEGMKGDTVSIIPLTKKIQGVTIRGCHWEIDNSDINRGQSRGVSNYLESDQAEISAREGMAFVFHICGL